ncbi:hypothetical protein GOODEAATRI_017368 [Goodea atripinnis]|uniref:Uncharacterized protein n=1 Tax=Goodea atripinnis TaxID=208336 RepID=A0ABV0NL13_9TELE
MTVAKTPAYKRMRLACCFDRGRSKCERSCMPVNVRCNLDYPHRDIPLSPLSVNDCSATLRAWLFAVGFAWLTELWHGCTSAVDIVGPHRVVAVPVPLVNNRKGSLLPLSKPSTLKLSLVGSRDLAQTGQLPGVTEETRRLQRVQSLPVKYRYHPGHSSITTLSQRQCKSQLPHLPPTLAVWRACVQQQHNQSMCLPGWSGCM